MQREANEDRADCFSGNASSPGERDGGTLSQGGWWRQETVDLQKLFGREKQHDMHMGKIYLCTILEKKNQQDSKEKLVWDT